MALDNAFAVSVGPRESFLLQTTKQLILVQGDKARPKTDKLSCLLEGINSLQSRTHWYPDGFKHPPCPIDKQAPSRAEPALLCRPGAHAPEAAPSLPWELIPSLLACSSPPLALVTCAYITKNTISFKKREREGEEERKPFCSELTESGLIVPNITKQFLS